MTEGKKVPNIFDYATSELSQDAFMCYLLAFGKAECKNDFPREYDMAHSFLEKCGISKDEEILEIRKQYKSIDVLVETNRHFLIIEDKTRTGEHDDQIVRYVSTLKNSEELPKKDVKVCYLKTMDYVYEYKTSNDTILSQEDCCSLKRGDLLEVLKENRQCNIIFESFYDRLISFDERARACDGKPISEWNREKWFAYLSSVLQGKKFDFGWVHNARGGFYACWFDWVDYGEGEKYKQIEISFSNDKTAEVKLCFKFSSADKETTKRCIPLIEDLQKEVVGQTYRASNRRGKTTTYAYSYETEQLQAFIDYPL